MVKNVPLELSAMNMEAVCGSETLVISILQGV